MAHPFLNKTMFSKCLLTVALFLNVLSFSGYYINNNAVEQPQIAQTEWVSSYKNKSNDYLFLDKIIKTHLTKNRFFNALKINKVIYLIVYNRLIKTQFNANLKEYNSFKSFCFYQIKTMPQSDKSAISTAISTSIIG
jgi:hypothetical protein